MWKSQRNEKLLNLKFNLTGVKKNCFKLDIIYNTLLFEYWKVHPNFFFRVDAYHYRSTELDEADLAIRGDLTDYEKHLVESQDLVQIRGKVSI